MAHEINHPYPEIYHIALALDVWATLIVGSERATLVDTGFGIDDLHAIVREITDRTPEVILTHGHFDHAMGVWQFGSSRMFGEDAEDFREETALPFRRQAMEAARAAETEIEIDEAAFLRAEIRMPELLTEGEEDLGGITVRILHVPGHTPGSAVLYIPKYKLLLSGDDWNPCTWLFFERALPVAEYRKNLRGLLDLPFENVLCSHRSALYPRSMPEDFAVGLTDDALRNAEAVSIEPYTHIRTFQASPAPDQVLVFDRDKWQDPLCGKDDASI